MHVIPPRQSTHLRSVIMIPAPLPPGMTGVMPDIVCISPVDGREVVRRRIVRAEIEAAVAAARKAQAEWKRVPVAERGKILSKAVDAMLAMRDEIAPGARLADGPPGALWRRRARAASRNARAP